MSLKQETGTPGNTSNNTLGDPSVNDVVIIIKSMWPSVNENDTMEYDWKNVKIFIHGKEIGPAKFQLFIDAHSINEMGMLKHPLPEIKINEFD